MPRIFITGSTDGLGLLAAELLKEGHQVIVHARNQARAAQVRTRVPDADAVVIGDVSAIEAIRGVAEQVNALGRCHAVIRNVGVGYREPCRIQTADGLSHVFAINVLAPYLLTALITRPQRLVYLTYDGHPLYTYIGDTAPGQARGNNLNLNGGLWHDVLISR